MSSPSFSSLPRREFLRLGFAGAAAAAILPAGCSGYRERLKPEEEQKLQFLTPKDFAILLAVADAVLPDQPPYPDHRGLGTVMQLDHEFAQWDEVRSKDIPLLLRIVEHGTVLFGFSWTRFSRLPLEERRAYLAQWGESSLNLRRSGYLALKGILAFYYFSNPAVWPAIGYDGPWLGRFEIPITPVEGLPG